LDEDYALREGHFLEVCFLREGRFIEPANRSEIPVF
jgi:hypothetical protein